MKHYMRLWPDSYCAIVDGSKTVELRLNDEKRRLIQLEDLIEFENTKTKETIVCVVLNKICYSDFKELYQHYTPISLGYKEHEVADYEDMYDYYSKEDIETYGALAIELCKLDQVCPAILVDYGICPTCFDKENWNCLYGNIKDKLIYRDSKIECFFDGNPKAIGHTIISTVNHYKDMIEAPKDLVVYIYGFAHKIMQILKKIYECESVYLCSMCDGPMNHFHIQLIPRYKDEERGSKNFVKKRKNYVLDQKKLDLMKELIKVE